MDTRSFILPSGKYFVGDIGRVILDQEVWEEVFCYNGEGDWDYKDKDYLLFKTGRDGSFANFREGVAEFLEVAGEIYSQPVISLPVESGSMGIISLEVIDITEEDLLSKQIGIVFDSSIDVRVDIQGDSNITYALHIYEDREVYLIDNPAILLVFDDDEFDENIFVARCSLREDGAKCSGLLHEDWRLG